ncbi:MAG: helix-turn-helix transcriptional regulator [Lachnospiraceae bacterium]|nr:helix-turn-helix transcriptional regulator [Lachnospiraceae bacterium]
MNTLQVSEIIKRTCKLKKLTIKEMLESCNINRNFMYDLKNNKVPAADKFETIADYLDCSVDYLLGRTDNPEINK